MAPGLQWASSLRSEQTYSHKEKNMKRFDLNQGTVQSTASAMYPIWACIPWPPFPPLFPL
jgi:hypothetical protein